MLDSHLFALFMVGALALNLTPGPDMTFVPAQAARRGTRAGLAAALGIGAGTIFHMALAAFGPDLRWRYAGTGVAFGVGGAALARYSRIRPSGTSWFRKSKSAILRVTTGHPDLRPCR
jgi:hypothetical protein